MESARQYFQNERVIRSKHGLVPLDLAELWRYRELFFLLAWRDILVRYKQTYLGVSWAILQPLLITLVFTVIFSKLAKFPSDGAPYLVLTFSAMLPWQFFSNALGESSNSLVASANIISKVYFPRLIIPASAVLSGLVDFAIGFVILIAMMIIYHVQFHLQLILLPLFLFIAIIVAFAAGVWLGALNVKYRDVKYIVPFFTRIGLYISPVGITSKVILEHFGPRIHFFYSLNPMVGVIDGFRWSIL